MFLFFIRPGGCVPVVLRAALLGVLLGMTQLGTVRSAEPSPGVLDLPGGGTLPGTLVPAAATDAGPRDTLLWKSPIFAEPFEFHLDAIVGDFTQLTLTHEGFATTDARDAHEAAWPLILAHQDAALADVALAEAGPTRAPLHNRSVPDATFIPMRSYPDVDAAVAWLRDVLGARERLRTPREREQQRVQLTIGTGAMVVVAWDAAAVPASGGRPPAVLMVRVPDVHAAYDRAIALGATGLTPPADHPDGERQASVRDPAGHAWTLTQTIADVDPASWGGELVE